MFSKMDNISSDYGHHLKASARIFCATFLVTSARKSDFLYIFVA